MLKQSIKRIKLLAGAFVLATGSLVFWPAPSANAQTGSELVSCTGTLTARYTPPLGTALQDTIVEVDEQVGADSGTCIAGPFISGHAKQVFHEQASCLIPPPAGTITPPYDLTFHWDNGDHSTMTFTLITVKRIAGQTIVTSLGTVTDGFGQGARVQREKTLVDLNVLECLASSVEQRNGTMTLTIGGI